MLRSRDTLRIARKELSQFFASPVAYLFLGSFVALALFIFFWVETFFGRNIADIRPMFEWMPILLIFLSAALTMRMWSEERRSGTLEHVLTLPASPWSFVLGKFIACKTLLFIALALTLPLPLSIASFADLDWGPIWSGYLATMMLGCAYLAVGLFVSSRSDSQIVSLMLTVLVCALLYMLGTPMLTDLLSQQAASWLKAMGTGSRFESITRGVLDLRDLYYYVSIVVVFLTLNRYGLEHTRWANNAPRAHHRRWRLFTLLLVANALLANLWLAPLTKLRVDVTEGQIYSISDATRGYLKQLQEPLLIRGYFSAKTHPYLAPLEPQLRDLLKEYEVEGEGRIKVEFIDPVANAEMEEEAGTRYGIHPMPLQVADRYQASLVNAYFHVLIKYGEEFKVLSFQDLLEVKSLSDAELDIRLRNPEYDITRAIKQVLYAYQSGGNLFDNIEAPVTLTGYISADQRLPESLRVFKETLRTVAEQYSQQAQGKFSLQLIEPEADNGRVAAQLTEQYGFEPMASNLLSDDTFYFYMLLQQGDLIVQLPLTGDLTEQSLNRSLDAGLKRFAQGFTKTVGLMAPQPPSYQQPSPSATKTAMLLQRDLSATMTVERLTLDNGQVADNIDLLMLIAPEQLNQQQLFAVDQFLMRGGTVIAVTSPFASSYADRKLTATAVDSGLSDWLAHMGIEIDATLVMDPHSAAFPIPVPRQVGAYTVQEMVMLDYPYFVDVRQSGLNQDNAITAGLPQLTLPWASPIRIDSAKQGARRVETLISSSDAAWLSDSSDIMPKVTAEGESGFMPGAAAGPQALAVSVQGRFDSYFAGKPSPRLNAELNQNGDSEVISSVIEHSPDSAQLIVVSANDFVADEVLGMLGSIEGTHYSLPVQMLVNAAEWSLEDRGLLKLRSVSHFSRTLPPMDDTERSYWEYGNYLFAIIGVLLVFLIRLGYSRAHLNRYRKLLAQEGLA